MTVVDFLKRVARGEFLIRQDGKRFETTPAESVMAREIVALRERIAAIEIKLEADR